MMDHDHFKSSNDTYGHATGNLFRKKLGRLINTFSRIEDFCCRYGREELVVLLTDVDIEEVKQRCEAIQKGVENLNVVVPGHPAQKDHRDPWRGILSGRRRERRVAIEAADRAFYRGKQAGINRICFTADRNSRNE